MLLLCVGSLCVGFLFSGVVLSVLSSFSNHLVEKERAGCFTLIVLWLSVFCVLFLPVREVGLQSVLVAFPCITQILS